MARLPQHNEASPCWPTYIGATGYAAHLAAVESQHQHHVAGKTLPRPAEIPTPRNPESDATTIHNSYALHPTTSPPPPPPNVLSPPPHASRPHSIHVLRCVHPGRCAVQESIQIVDGSPEVLEEVRVREGRGSVGEEQEKKEKKKEEKKEKKKEKKEEEEGKIGVAKVLKKVLGEGARRVALGLWARGM